MLSFIFMLASGLAVRSTYVGLNTHEHDKLKLYHSTFNLVMHSNAVIIDFDIKNKALVVGS